MIILLKDLLKRLYTTKKEKELEEEYQRYIIRIEEITGARFKDIPAYCFLREKKIKKIIQKELGSSYDSKVCIYDMKENKVYLPKELKKDRILFDFYMVHELTQPLFFQNSLAYNQLEKKEYFVMKEYMNPIFEYLLGKVGLEKVKIERDFLDLLTVKALAEGFANIVALLFLKEKYGKEGLLKGIEYTLYNDNLVMLDPFPSFFKLELILHSMGTLFTRYYYLESKQQEFFRYFLNIRREELPKIREEMIKLYSKVIHEKLKIFKQ
jgi:hypothetical protein